VVVLSASIHRLTSKTEVDLDQLHCHRKPGRTVVSDLALENNKTSQNNCKHDILGM